MSQPAKKTPPPWEKPLRAKIDYRDDGWPFCPACGEDELMSNEIPASPHDRMLCLRCGWVGTVPLRRLA